MVKVNNNLNGIVELVTQNVVRSLNYLLKQCLSNNPKLLHIMCHFLILELLHNYAISQLLCHQNSILTFSAITYVQLIQLICIVLVQFNN